MKVQGVLQVGGELRALVQTATGAGTVCVGPRGRCPGDAAARCCPRVGAFKALIYAEDVLT